METVCLSFRKLPSALYTPVQEQVAKLQVRAPVETSTCWVSTMLVVLKKAIWKMAHFVPKPLKRCHYPQLMILPEFSKTRIITV